METINPTSRNGGKRMIIQVPSWLKELPATTLVNSKEVAKIYGYSTPDSLTSAMERGTVPRNTTSSKKFDKTRNANGDVRGLRPSVNKGVRVSNYWKISDIIKDLRSKGVEI